MRSSAPAETPRQLQGPPPSNAVGPSARIRVPFLGLFVEQRAAMMVARLALWSAIVAGLALTGCQVEGSVPEPTPGRDGGAALPGVGSGHQGDSDAGPSDGGAADGSATDGGDSGGGGSCDQKQSTASLGALANGHHNAGESCGDCHSSGRLKWTVAGTLYDAVGGTTGVAGATIHVTDSKGVKVTILTANNGNFWTTTALTPPLRVSGSLCPNSAAMSSDATGFCNSCHTSGFRVHVP